MSSNDDKEMYKAIFWESHVLFYFVLFCFVLFCFVLFCFVLFGRGTSLLLHWICLAEIGTIEQKYNKLKRPIYQERSTVLQHIPEFWSKTVCIMGTCLEGIVVLNCVPFAVVL